MQNSLYRQTCQQKETYGNSATTLYWKRKPLFRNTKHHATKSSEPSTE